MIVKDLNTVPEEDIIKASFNYEAKNMKGIPVLDGVVGDMVGYLEHKSHDGTTNKYQVWEVVCDGYSRFLKASDIRTLLKKERGDIFEAAIQEALQVHKGDKVLKGILYNYEGRLLEVKPLPLPLAPSKYKEPKIDRNYQMLMGRFLVIRPAGKIFNQAFGSALAYFLWDAMTGRIILLTVNQIEGLIGQQRRIDNRIKRSMIHA